MRGRHHIFWIVFLLLIGSCGGLGYVYRHRVALALEILSGDTNRQFQKNMRGFLARQWQLSPLGSTVFLGDSHIQSLHVGSDRVINLGIGGETVADIIARLPDYTGLGEAERIIVCIGANDVLRNRSDKAFEQSVIELLGMLPDHVSLRLAAIPPLASKFKNATLLNSRITRFNHILEMHCKAANCTYIRFPPSLVGSGGALKEEFHSGDHLHLSVAANRIWLADLNPAIAQGHGY
jgi:lysophospholipase L1-like esterase